MFKLLASLFAVVDKLLGLWHDAQIRQQTELQVKDAVDAEVAKTEAAVAVADPVRDDRLRRRFDTAYAESNPSAHDSVQ
jgi:hypothetical protein